MSEPTLADIRDEFVDVVIGPRLETLLYSVVVSTAPAYPALEYNPSGIWNDETLRDAAQDWIVDRLVERGDLGPILASAKSEIALRAILVRSFKQHLINKRARSSATNLFDRMVAALTADFDCVSDPGTIGERRWSVKGATGRESEVDSLAAVGNVVGDLVLYAGTRSDADLGVVRYGPFSLKSSPILRANDLRSFLTELLVEAGGALSTTELFTVLRHRFNLVALPPQDIETIADTFTERALATPSHRDGSVHEAAVATIVLARLEPGQLADLRAIAGADSINAAVRTSGRTARNLASSLESSMALIADHVDSLDEARRVHQLIVESLYEGNETR